MQGQAMSPGLSAQRSGGTTSTRKGLRSRSRKLDIPVPGPGSRKSPPRPGKGPWHLGEEGAGGAMQPSPPQQEQDQDVQAGDPARERRERRAMQQAEIEGVRQPTDPVQVAADWYRDRRAKGGWQAIGIPEAPQGGARGPGGGPQPGTPGKREYASPHPGVHHPNSGGLTHTHQTPANCRAAAAATAAP